MSGYTTTPNYGFRKPITGADNDLWGGDWNLNADSLDTIIKNTNNLLANYLPLAGGTITGALTFASGGTLQAYDPRQPNVAKAWGDASSNVGGYIQPDGTWQLPATTIKTLTAPTGTITTLTTTTFTGSTVNTPNLAATGGAPTIDQLTIKNSGVVLLAEPRNPVPRGWVDGVGNYDAMVQPDGQWRIQSLYIGTLTTGTYAPTSFSPAVVNFGTSLITTADRRNRYAEAWTDGTDQGAAQITSTGSLTFTPSSGVLAKHLQSQIQRSHMLTQGPPSHSASADTVGTSGTTYHLCCTLDSGGFDAVRLVFAVLRPGGGTVTGCVAVAANLSDMLNPKDAGGNPMEWKPVGFGTAGTPTDWEDQPYGTVKLFTSAVSAIGSSALTFTDTTGVTVGMTVYVPPGGNAFGMRLPNCWAQVAAVTPTSVTLSKAIQNLDIASGQPVFFTPNTLAMPSFGSLDAQDGACAKLVTSDWVPISSLDRSDGGRWPVLMARVYVNGTHGCLVTTLSQNNWSGQADDRTWFCASQAGEFVSAGNQSGFTNATDNGTMIVGWLQYYSRSRGCTVQFAGDSITQGIGGIVDGIGAQRLAAQALSTPACPVTTCGVVNGWNNAGVNVVIWDSARNHIDVFKPQVLVLAPWTRNGEFSKPPTDHPPYSQESADFYWQQTLRIVTKARRKYGTQVMYAPQGAQGSYEMTAATELVRMSAVNRMRAANASGEMMLDQDALLGLGTTPINTTPFQGIHPPAPAQTILALDVQRQIKSAIGIA